MDNTAKGKVRHTVNMRNNSYIETKIRLNRLMRQREKDMNVLQAICIFVEMQRRKEISMEQLKDDRYARMALNYLDMDFVGPLIREIRNYSDSELDMLFNDCFRFSSFISRSVGLISMAISDPTQNLTIEFNMSLRYLPISVLKRNDMRIVIDTRSNDLEENTAEAALFGLFSYLYPERLFIKGDIGMRYHPNYVFYSNDPERYPLEEISESIGRTEHPIVINERISSHDSKSTLDDLLKEGCVKAIIKGKTLRSSSWYKGFVLGRECKDVSIIDSRDMLDAYRNARRGGESFDFDYMMRNVGVSVPLDVAVNTNILNNFYATSSNYSLLARAKKYVTLGSLVDMRYVKYDDYPRPTKSGNGSYIADRCVFDKNGAMTGIDDSKNWDHVNDPKCEASKLENNEIYITRKSSATHVGIFDEVFFVQRAAMRPLEEKPRAYVFAASVILTVKDGIDPYYIFAYLNELNRSDNLVQYKIMGENENLRSSCTISHLSKIDIPILSDEEMRRIGEKYHRYYRDYLNSVYEGNNYKR